MNKLYIDTLVGFVRGGIIQGGGTSNPIGRAATSRVLGGNLRTNYIYTLHNLVGLLERL